ncbi:MAG: hypothetical protein LBR99_04810 [Treponema sp.]|nr:hypothetical protein [Treponema sp.]
MCWYCGSPIVDADPIGRSLRCAECGKDLRVCRHCRFYLPGAWRDCSESNAEPPQEKDRGNFCDWFSLNSRFRGETAGEKGAKKKADSAKSAFDSLFSN